MGKLQAGRVQRQLVCPMILVTDLVFYEVFRIPECSHNHDRLIIYNNLQPVIIDLRCQCQEVLLGAL